MSASPSSSVDLGTGVAAAAASGAGAEGGSDFSTTADAALACGDSVPTLPRDCALRKPATHYLPRYLPAARHAARDGLIYRTVDVLRQVLTAHCVDLPRQPLRAGVVEACTQLGADLPLSVNCRALAKARSRPAVCLSYLPLLLPLLRRFLWRTIRM